MSTGIDDVVISDHVTPWLSGSFYGLLATLQLGTGVAHAANVNGIAETTGPLKIDIIAVTAIASSAVTLTLGLAHAWSAYLTRTERDRMANQERLEKAEAERQWRAVEARLKLLERNIPCEVENCPIVATARGDVPYNAIPLNKVPTAEFDILKTPVKAAANDEPTVDLR